ncbi:MAG: glycosyltransferase family 4 protein [Actinomycetota bacterium]|nr:glycosyltransferase family 4 protein [Actinomycetota bacterium]
MPLEELPPQPPPPRIKVLHVITKFWAGAGGNTLVSALGMDPRRYEVWVAACEGGDLWARAEAAGIRTVKLRRFRDHISPLEDLGVLAQLVALIRRERFSIVHTHSAKGGFLGRLAAWGCGTPVIVHTTHGPSFHEFMSPARRKLYIGLDRLARPMTDRFLDVAPSVVRQAVETRIARPGSIAVVPSAVEMDGIPAESDPSVRPELGLPPGAPVVGTVGRLDFQKAPLDFVRMAAVVARTRPDARFVMVGDGELADQARAEAARLGVDVLFTFTGFRPDAARIASAFDVFVVSSLYEGLGRSLTEALASGRPVAATAVNGVPDLIEHGATGLLAPPRDPEALARCVLWLLEHPHEARQMGLIGRNQVRELFDPARMCELLDREYRRLLGLPEPPGSAAAGTERAPAVELAAAVSGNGMARSRDAV